MNDHSKNIAELVEGKLDLVRRYLLQSLKGLEAKEKKLQAVQESVRKSSENLSKIRETVQDKEKVSHFLLQKGLKELEIKREKLGFIQENVMNRLEKLNAKETLIEGLFEKVELELEEFETIRKLVDDCFVEIQFEARQLDDNMRKVEEIKNQIESRENGVDREKGEIERRERVLGLKKEELVAKEIQLEAREKILGLKQEELVGKEKELEAREKILNLMKKPDLKGKELDSVRTSKDEGCKGPSDSTHPKQPEEEQRQKFRKRDGIDKNGNFKSSKRCCRRGVDFEGSFNSRDNSVGEQIAADDYESGPADSGCDLSDSDATGACLESDSKSGGEDDNQLMPELAATKGPETKSVKIECPDSRHISDSNPIDYSKSLFNDFDDDDKLKRLAAGQTWATYDEKDDLPRSFFLVMDVLKSRKNSGIAKLRVVWLQPLPSYLSWERGRKELKYVNLPIGEKSWKEWIDCGLPVGCGVFKRGKEQSLSLSVHRLSDQVCCKIKHSSYLIHPGKGEIWALYKDWDITKWDCNPEDHRNCNYEIVEVLDRNSKGTRVTCLDKLEGFVCLFQRRSHSEKDSFLIEDQELFRFSHKVPSFKMTGTKRHGVPEGSFELDPKDLPAGLC